MWTIIGIVVGAIIGIAVAIGVVYHFVSNTSDDEKSSGLAAILSVLFSPIIGFAYARPPAWGIGVAATLFFALPIGIGVGVLASNGNVVVAGVIGVYLAVSVAVTAVLMAQDQNEHVTTDPTGDA